MSQNFGSNTGRLRTRPTAHPSESATTVISPPGRWPSSDFREIWAYRDLIVIFVWRDLSIRYKQSLLGIGWAVLQPIILMVVFSMIFGTVARLPSDGSPYPIFTLSALLPWIYFSRSLVGATDSLVNAANLITKVYFPRLILPISKVFTGLVDFVIALLVLAAMMIWYDIVPNFGLLLLPVFLALALLAALGSGLWLSAINVTYRDIGLAVPYLVQVWLFASPVAYSSSLVPEAWRWVYALNPMVGVIDGFRWALLGQPVLNAGTIMTSFAVTLLLLFSGLIFFKRTEHRFADVI